MLFRSLVLYAPEKNFVFVNGDFCQWQYNNQYQLHRTPDEKRYWLEIENLIPGFEYAYQYIIDGNTTIADPYTEKVLDPWNDQYIHAQTYPNLKPYPSGKTQGIVSVLQTNENHYSWHSNGFIKPAKTDLVIYELLLRDFLEAHNYQIGRAHV